jgi:hypothetical protein
MPVDVSQVPAQQTVVTAEASEEIVIFQDGSTVLFTGIFSRVSGAWLFAGQVGTKELSGKVDLVGGE